MRILIGSESFYPMVSGVAVAAWNLAAYLANQGHQVLVLAPSTGRSIQREEYPEGFSVERLELGSQSLPQGFPGYALSLQQDRGDCRDVATGDNPSRGSHLHLHLFDEESAAFGYTSGNQSSFFPGVHIELYQVSKTDP